MGNRPDWEVISQYLDAGYDLIPLHRWDYVDDQQRPRGKSPKDAHWRTKVYTKHELQKHVEAGGNVGVRLGPQDLVLDVDPRNFPEGDDVLERFKADLGGLDLSPYPQVVTGSGGLHAYMRKPADVLVRDSLEAYPGIEFKTLGRQVVAAGSKHPNGKMYELDWTAPALEERVPAPDNFLLLIKRPPVVQAAGVGEHRPELVAEMLDALDPEDYQDYTKWIELAMAVHHASGGEARQEFIEWSTRDPQYRDQAWNIGRHWDSMDAKRGNGITYRTLHKAVINAGKQELVPRPKAEDDFKAVDPEDIAAYHREEREAERKHPLERMNDVFCVVNDQGRFRVFEERLDPTFTPARRTYLRYDKWNFEQLHSTKRVQKGEKTVSVAEEWLRWGKRRQYSGIIFDPEREHAGYLNLWKGWSVEPKKGDWSMLQELLLKVLCEGSDELYGYVMDWAADMVQRPWRPAGVALCFQGEKGTGKGTFGRAMTSLAGTHGLHITSPEHLTGRFNSHLRDVVLLFADEAINPYNKEHESRFKGLITEPTLVYEQKGKDPDPGPNRLHCIMASNEDWFVNAGTDGERRYFISRVTKGRQGDLGFFNELHRQLDNGGLQAMLFDLLQRPLGKDWRPGYAIPSTDAAIHQKVRNLHQIGQWWLNVLREGTLPGDDQRLWNGGPDGISDGWVDVFKRDLREDYHRFCREHDLRASALGASNDAVFSVKLGELVGEGFDPGVKLKVPDDRPDLTPHGDGRLGAFRFPPLDRCRRHMENKLGGRIAW